MYFTLLFFEDIVSHHDSIYARRDPSVSTWLRFNTLFGKSHFNTAGSEKTPQKYF